MLSEVAASTSQASHATALHEFLTPFSGRLLAAPIGLACLGAADRYLGMLEAMLERWADARNHFELAVELEGRVGGRALLTRTRYWQARSLLAHGGSDDRMLALGILQTVVAETSHLGMHRLNAAATELLGGDRRASASPGATDWRRNQNTSATLRREVSTSGT
jgi:hypothetical protein